MTVDALIHLSWIFFLASLSVTDSKVFILIRGLACK